MYSAKLQLDAKSFNAGMEQAAKKGKQSMDTVSKTSQNASKAVQNVGNAAAGMAGRAGPAISGVTNILSKMGPVGLAAAGVFATVALGIAACITAGVKFANAIDGIAKRAKGVDMTAQAFFGLEGAVSKAGGDIERTTQIIQKLDDALQKAASGSKDAIDAFRSIGLSWADLKDMTPEDRLIAIVRRIRELKQEGKDVPSVFRSLLGRRGMNELNKLAADTQFETNLKSGGLSDKAVDNSEKLATSITELKQNFVKMLSNSSAMITLVKMINNGVVAIAKHFGQNLNPNMNQDTENLTAVGAEFNRQYTSGNLNARTVQKNLSANEMADLILTAFKGGTIDPEDFENINFGTDKNKVQFKQFRSMFDLRETELENFGKALQELAKTDPEALRQSFLGFTHNLLYLEDEMGAQLAGAALGWKGVDAFDTGTWFKFKDQNKPSTPSTASKPESTSSPSATSNEVKPASNKSPLDIDALQYAYDEDRIKKLFSDVAKYSDNATKQILEAFYTQMSMSGVDEGVSAADRIIQDISEAFDESSSPDEIKRRLSSIRQDLVDKIPDAIADEHRDFVKKIIEDIEKENSREIQFKNDEQTKSDMQKSFQQGFSQYQTRVTGLIDSIKNIKDGGDKIHTNELAEKGGFVGGVTVERSDYEHRIIQVVTDASQKIGGMSAQLAQMNQRLRDY